jgi:hypothetical protein
MHLNGGHIWEDADKKFRYSTIADMTYVARNSIPEAQDQEAATLDVKCDMSFKHL